MHCAWFRSAFLRALIFLQIKDGGANLWWEPVLQNVWIIWSPLLYFNSKSFMEPNSLSLIRFLCIGHDTGVLLKEPWNFYKLKRGDLIAGGNQFRRMSDLFGLPFRISVLKVLGTQIHNHFLDFNVLVMIQEYFSQSLELSRY